MSRVEKRQIPVTALRDIGGKPTCSNVGQFCPFLIWQQAYVCGARVLEPVAKDDSGILRPVDGCPVWRAS